MPERKHWLDVATFIFVVATATAAGFAAWYTRQQWLTAHETLVVSERASVAFATPNIFPAKDPEKGKFFGVDVAMQNGGGTRTRDFQFQIKCATSTVKLAEPWGIFHQEAIEHVPDVIPPKGERHAICGFILNDIVAMSDGKIVGYILGEVRYRDVFDPTIHITQLAQELTLVHYEAGNETSPLRLSVQTIAKGKHNCADESCPTD